MHFPVVNINCDIAGIRTGKRTFFNLFHDALHNGRHETCINGTTYHAVVEHHFPAPWQNVLFLIPDREFGRNRHVFGIGLYHHVHLPELTGTARLFLVTVHRFCGFGNGFAVSNLGVNIINGNFIQGFDMPFNDIKVKLALPFNNKLFQFLGIAYQQSLVDLMHFIQQTAKFFVVRLIFSFHSQPDLWCRENDGRNHVLRIFV